MLGLRMRAHSKNAQTIAEFLAGRDDGAEVYFPGFATHSQDGLAKRQMSGFGGIVSSVRRAARSAHAQLQSQSPSSRSRSRWGESNR
jgi:cystathionine beta-lyase/cystathionine gamma-synthase